MNNIQGYFTELWVKTAKLNEVQPGIVSVTPLSVQTAMPSGSYGMTEMTVHPDGWWKTVPNTCSCHGKRTKPQQDVITNRTK